MMEVWVDHHHLLLLLLVLTAASLSMAEDQSRCSQELHRLREQEKLLKLRVQKQEVLLQQLQLLNRPRPHKTTTANQDHRHAHNAAANQQEPPPADGQSQHRDCSQVFQAGARSSGVYSIYPQGGSSADSTSPIGGSTAAPVPVYCDMSDGGGWTVVQRRMDGSQRFNRSWSDYRSGFGDLRSEFWLGNDLLHQLTKQGDYVLRIHLEDFEGNQRYAEYKNFTVANEEDQYRLAFGVYSGTAGDALSASYQPGVSAWASHQGMAFSTYDRDNDRYTGNCAAEDQGGWWFNRCHSAHLNGVYHPGGPYSGATDHGVVWFPWRGWWYSLRTTVMKIRPQRFTMDPQLDPNAVLRTRGTTQRP